MMDLEETLNSDNLKKRRKWFLLLASIFGVYAAMTLVDVILDLKESGPLHIGLEVGLFLLAGFLSYILGSAYRRSSVRERTLLSSNRELENQKETFRLDSEKYRQGLSDSINHQLDRWNLSPAEKEVALLLLKGLSHKEIATTRNTTEKTARIQSQAVYSKSGIQGRAELSAFFMEDLLVL